MGLVHLKTVIHSDLIFIQVDSLAVSIRFVPILIKLGTLLATLAYLYACLYV